MGGSISKMIKQGLLATVRDRYRASFRKEKSRILDEFIVLERRGGCVTIPFGLAGLWKASCFRQPMVSIRTSAAWRLGYWIIWTLHGLR